MDAILAIAGAVMSSGLVLMWLTACVRALVSIFTAAADPGRDTND